MDTVNKKEKLRIKMEKLEIAARKAMFVQYNLGDRLERIKKEAEELGITEELGLKDTDLGDLMC